MRAGSNPGKPGEGTGGTPGRAGHGTGVRLTLLAGGAQRVQRGAPPAAMGAPGKSGEKPVIGDRGGVASVSQSDHRGPGRTQTSDWGRDQHRGRVPRAGPGGRRRDPSLSGRPPSGPWGSRLGLGERMSPQCARPNGAPGRPQNRPALPLSLRSGSTFSRPWI